MSMKRFSEIVQDITDGYCGGWTCLSDGEIRYCEADVEVTDRIHKAKEELVRAKAIEAFFKVWRPRNDDVLFILFKDGTRDYYNVHYRIIIGRDTYLYIEDIWGNTMHIPYTDIEDYAVGTKKPGESALAAIPEWFEDRIDKYTEKLKEEKNMEEKWYLYYARNSSGNDEVVIAQTLDDAIDFCKDAGFSSPTYFAEADSRDKYVKASGNGGSVIRVTEYTDGTACFATQKYADKINYLKFEYNKETRMPCGAIEVRYKDGHTRVFDEVTEYKEVVSMLEEKQLYIKDLSGRRYYVPLAKVIEYVVDMPNDKRIVIEPQDDVIDKEKFLSMFNVGSYYKISYTDDLIEGDKNTFCIIRFKEYLYDEEAIFENIYDHHMGLVPLITVDMLNIRNDDYTIVKIPYGGDIRE